MNDAPMGTPLRVLLVEDSEDDAALLVRELGRGGYDVKFDRVESAEGLAAALEREDWDVIFGDYTMPGFRGTAALTMVRERDLDVPFIFVSGTMGEDVAVDAMKAGANDYVIKGNLKRLLPAVARELRDAAVRRERARLEAELRQAQRLESVGRLAGGIAHDFNNVLTVIMGNASLLMESADLPPHHRDDVVEIKHAAQSAAALTRQLLAFSRRQRLDLRALDLNRVVADTDGMMRRAIGEDVRLVTKLDPELGYVKADLGQLQQVLMNLAINSRDAMQGGGTLTIETANAELMDVSSQAHGLAPRGSYVLLTVSDTGSGMDAETQAHIFEPFFTTKEPGKGTGLGLATVYGIVRQSGGYISVHSEVGRGTTFRIYLPRTDEAPQW